jgi:hypothetical protein
MICCERPKPAGFQSSHSAGSCNDGAVETPRHEREALLHESFFTNGVYLSGEQACYYLDVYENHHLYKSNT